ncbi:MAG: hypothetical protein K2G04_05095, partial [Oscillospiraceae bacterium]|nr:hypothetical protein [Oscillospiraceae bacterium]
MGNYTGISCPWENFTFVKVQPFCGLNSCFKKIGKYLLKYLFYAIINDSHYSERKILLNINKILANEFKLRQEQIDNTVSLIDDGKTIPFIARYRKELTGSLADQV